MRCTSTTEKRARVAEKGLVEETETSWRNAQGTLFWALRRRIASTTALEGDDVDGGRVPHRS